MLYLLLFHYREVVEFLFIIISFFCTMERIWLLLFRIEYFLGGERMAHNLSANSSYINLFNVEEFSQRTSNIVSALDSMNNKSFIRTEENQLNELRAVRKNILDFFKVKSTAELQKKYQSAIASSSLINFSGANLKRIFITPAEEGVDFDLMSEAVYDFIEYKIRNSTDNITKTIAELTQETLEEGLLKLYSHFNTGKTGGHFRAKQSRRGAFSKKNYSDAELRELIKEIFNTAEMTANFKKYAIANFPEIIEQNKSKKGKGGKKQSNIQNIVFYQEADKNNGGLFQYTAKLSETEVTVDYASSKNQEIINYFVSNSGVAGTEDETILREIFYEIIAKNPKVFFVGESVKEITGLLGEVRGIFFLKKLFKGSAIEAAVSWYGGTHTGKNNSKPHRDIVIEACNNLQFGVQSKNSINEVSDNYSHKIDFWSKNADTFIKDLDDNIFFNNPGWKNVFLNYFGSVFFNIPYIAIKGEGRTMYEQAERARDDTARGKDFNSSRQDLLQRTPLVDRLLSLFASSFLYASVQEDLIEFKDLNSIYLIGASGILTAADIVENILRIFQKNQTSFRVTAHYKSKGSHNIVDMMNKHSYFATQKRKAKAESSKEEREKLLKKLEQERTSYNKKNILNDVNISAQFTFSKNLMFMSGI